MPTKIRLQRQGRKARPFYHIVIADGRAPRDGRFIEKIGTYNPLTKPADIDLDFDRALYWMQVGAQPTDTVRAILSYKGILYKFHLLKGVKKGALTPEQVEEKFQAWLEEKESRIRNKVKENELLQKEELKKKREAESKINEARAAELAKKYAKDAEKQAARKEQAEEAAAEAEAEEVVAEAAQEEVQETVAEVEATPEQTESAPAITAETAETVQENEAAPEKAEDPTPAETTPEVADTTEAPEEEKPE